MSKEQHLMSIEDFKVFCENHDHFYNMSDDHRAYTKGSIERQLIYAHIDQGGQAYKDVWKFITKDMPYGV